MEEVLIACCCRCFEDSGANIILKQCEIFVPGVVKSGFSGSPNVNKKTWNDGC